LSAALTAIAPKIADPDAPQPAVGRFFCRFEILAPSRSFPNVAWGGGLGTHVRRGSDTVKGWFISPRGAFAAVVAVG